MSRKAPHGLFYNQVIKRMDKDRIKYEQKKKARLQRKCPGHWINKGYGLRSDRCYENGICLICGGLEIKNESI